MQTIPVSEFPNFVQAVVLDEVSYSLRFLWSEKQGSWFLSIMDSAGADLITGIKIVQGADMLAAYPELGGPPGKLIAVDGSGALGDVGRDDLSSGKVRLVYISEAEVAAATP